MRIPKRVKKLLNTFLEHVTDSVEVNAAAMGVLADDVEILIARCEQAESMVQKLRVDLAIFETAQADQKKKMHVVELTCKGHQYLLNEYSDRIGLNERLADRIRAL